MPVALVAKPEAICLLIKSKISVTVVVAKVKAKALGNILMKKLARDDSRKGSLSLAGRSRRANFLREINREFVWAKAPSE
ncbi:hypothetical protein V1478_004753 [Vespula squamosa]|uniref:Uncharacterized protein n=1 Tax=Vespula squamosa TaxID=30214 RepID=A0ABD2BH33_VESSQ